MLVIQHAVNKDDDTRTLEFGCEESIAAVYDRLKSSCIYSASANSITFENHLEGDNEFQLAGVAQVLRQM